MIRTPDQPCLVCGRTGTRKDSEACIGDAETACIKIALARQEIDMKSKCAVAFDPGFSCPSGMAIWGVDGLAYSSQGSTRQILREWTPWLKRANVGLICVEGAYVGKNMKSAMDIKGEGRFILGALWCAGVDVPFWEPTAAAWRKIIGFPFHQPKVEGQKRKRTSREEYEEMARAHAAVHFGRAVDESRTHEAEAICMAQLTYEKMLENDL